MSPQRRQALRCHEKWRVLRDLSNCNGTRVFIRVSTCSVKFRWRAKQTFFAAWCQWRHASIAPMHKSVDCSTSTAFRNSVPRNGNGLIDFIAPGRGVVKSTGRPLKAYNSLCLVPQLTLTASKYRSLLFDWTGWTTLFTPLSIYHQDTVQTKMRRKMAARMRSWA